MRTGKMLAWTAILMATALAFGLRAVPAYTAVFTSHGVSFEEPDAWFHMRTIHNLLAHFPWRSGFDPYALYPGGRNIGADAWDYLVSSTAWLLGGGAPSEVFADEVGAWLPAILGALFPLMVFLVARRLFGVMTGVLSAFWMAMMPGTFLWISHLGMPDHHAAEGLASFLTLGTLCAAADAQGRRRWVTSAIGGIALGLYLDVRPAGIFVPAILAVSAVIKPALSGVVALAIAVACLVFLPSSGEQWSQYTWLSLLTCLAGTCLVAASQWFATKRNWSRQVQYLVIFLALGASIGCVGLLFHEHSTKLIATIQKYLPGHSGTGVAGTVKELQPLWTSGGFPAVFNEFGSSWMLAVSGLGVVLWSAWQGGREATFLFTTWSLTMLAGVFLQVRMAVYAGPAMAMLAGVAGARIVDNIPSRVQWLRGIAAGILVVLGAAVTLPFAIQQKPEGPDSDWWAALTWLRWNTPEPMGDAAAWYRSYPRLGPDDAFVYPKSAYGILSPWDKGWWISGIARRIPASNGLQDGALETARFLTDTRPEEALSEMRNLGARYVAIGAGPITVELPGLVATAGRQLPAYSRQFYVRIAGGQDSPLRVWLPDYYRAMATRLYTFEGRRTAASGEVEVFITEMHPGPHGVDREMVLGIHKFASDKEARAWIALHPSEKATLASADPIQSCVDLEEIPWLRRVFASNDEALRAGVQPSAVKIFALTQ